MNFEENIKRLQAAQGDPQKLALATVDIVLAAHSPDLRAALEAAAVPHWFDARILGALLETDAATANKLLDELQALPMVESFAAREAWNVHEATRLALRSMLAHETPERFQTLSILAANSFPGNEPALQVETIYHRLLGDPKQASDELELLWKRWTQAGRDEPLQALGLALGELIRTDQLAPATRARALLRCGSIRRKRLTLRTREDLASEALKLFQGLGDSLGELDARDQLGDIFTAEGRLADALREFRSLQQIARLMENEPENTDLQRDLAVSYSKVGAVLQVQGQLPAALKEFQAHKDGMTRLTERDSRNTDWQRDLAISHFNVGGVLQAQGDLVEALAEYQSGKQILQELTTRDPENTNWESDLAVSRSRVGAVLLRQQQLDAALAEYQAGKKIAQRLTERDPDNSDWQCALSIAKFNVGGALEEQGNLPEALTEYQSGNEILQQLITRDPENTNWERNLSVSHARVGAVFQTQRQFAKALTEYQADNEIIQRLTERDPENTDWQRDLSISHLNLAGVLEAQGNLTAALAECEAARNIAEPLASRDPSNAEWQEVLDTAQRGINRLKEELAKRS